MTTIQVYGLKCLAWRIQLERKVCLFIPFIPKYVVAMTKVTQETNKLRKKIYYSNRVQKYIALKLKYATK